MAANAHPHQHSIKVIGTGANLEHALNHALAGLSDPDGHHALMDIHSFEIIKFAGTIGSDGGKTVQVTLEAYATHKE